MKQGPQQYGTCTTIHSRNFDRCCAQHGNNDCHEKRELKTSQADERDALTRKQHLALVIRQVDVLGVRGFPINTSRIQQIRVTFNKTSPTISTFQALAVV